MLAADSSRVIHNSLLGRLRLETRVEHAHAESLVGLPETVSTHIRTLEIFYGFLEPWEQAAARSLATIRNALGDRRKIPMLAADLDHFAISASRLAELPRCVELQSLVDVPTALGSMYVFEGATLGGQVLSKHVEAHLGLRDGIGYSFYRSYGSQVGEMWRDFGRVLVSNTPPASHDRVVKSARDTFKCFSTWIEDQIKNQPPTKNPFRQGRGN